MNVHLRIPPDVPGDVPAPVTFARLTLPWQAVAAIGGMFLLFGGWAISLNVRLAKIEASIERMADRFVPMDERVKALEWYSRRGTLMPPAATKSGD